jgi:YHS domain-containing protein
MVNNQLSNNQRMNMKKCYRIRKVKTMKNTMLILATLAVVFFVGCKKSEPAKPAMDMSKTKETAQQTAAAATEQTVCPVMAGNPIDKNVFVEYEGKKVYFCCEDCKATFSKDPEKYIKDLPQFKQ